jgi:hypothetical protein
MEQLITSAIYFVLGYVISSVILKLIRTIAERRQQLTDEDAESWREYVEDMIHVVREDRIGDIRYWYDRDSEKFLAQGKDHEEIVNALKMRFPEGIFVINNNQMIMGPDYNEVIQFDELKIQREN